MPCLNGGNCTSPDVCTCPDFYIGVSCERLQCEYNTTIAVSSAAEGMFQIKNYPEGYVANQTCGWELNIAETGYFLQLEIVTGVIENYNDFMAVYSTSGIEHIKTSANLMKITAVIPSSSAYVYFYSNSAGFGTGFQVSYSVVNASTHLDGFSGTMVPADSVLATSTISPSSSTTTTPTTTTAFPDTGLTLFQGSSGNRFVVDLETFGAPNQIDLYEGITSGSGPIMVSTNAASQTFQMVTSVTQMMFQYTSPLAPVVPNDQFRLTFSEEPTVTKCSGVVTLTASPSGSVTSENYPNRYASGSHNCQWLITAPVGYAVVLDIWIDSLEAQDDSVVVSGILQSATTPATLCNQGCYTRLISLSNQLSVDFTTDQDNRVGNGFRFEYKQIRQLPEFSYNNNGSEFYFHCSIDNLILNEHLFRYNWLGS